MPYPAVKCYWLEKTDQWVCHALLHGGTAVARSAGGPYCPKAPHGGLSCRTELEIGRGVGPYPEVWPGVPAGEDREVARCQWCGRVLCLPQVSRGMETLLRDSRNGRLVRISEAEPGAMWDAEWCGMDGDRGYTGPDGIALCVKCPNGHDWMVDSQASNCTMDQWVAQPPDREGKVWRKFHRTHYCWVRHGDPRTGELHVDKQGVTCAAGAGSIVAGDYHGFLHNGWLTAG